MSDDRPDPFTMDDVGTVPDDIRWLILSTIAGRCGHVPDIHPRMLEAVEAAARRVAEDYEPSTEVARARIEGMAAQREQIQARSQWKAR